MTRSSGASARSGLRLSVAGAVGAVAGVAVALAVSWAIGGLVGWVVAASTFLLWTWFSLWPSDGERTSGPPGSAWPAASAGVLAASAGCWRDHMTPGREVP